MNDSLLKNALSSSAASIIGRLFCHPLDTAKARLQAPGGHVFRGPWDALSQTARAEGIAGLYRGLGVVLLLGTPGTVMYLCSYDVVKARLLQGTADENDFMVHFASGMSAEAFSCLIYVPVDVIKERMQVQRPGDQFAYRNTFDALRTIGTTEGLRGIYRGYWATLGSFGPFSALYFVFYERTKHLTRQRLSGRMNESARELENVEIPFHLVLLCSASSGATASWLTSPLDLAKLRLQVSRGRASVDPSNIAYRGAIDVLIRAYQEGGIRALFRGAGARVLHFTPATTITMSSYETCRSFINKLF
jgi:hypothetical protein